jgi:hypothetical protein
MNLHESRSEQPRLSSTNRHAQNIGNLAAALSCAVDLAWAGLPETDEAEHPELDPHKLRERLDHLGLVVNAVATQIELTALDLGVRIQALRADGAPW